MSRIRRWTSAIFIVAMLVVAGIISAFWFGKNNAEERLAELVISEVVTSNENTATDEDGDASDWIEIHNRSDRDIDVSTYVLVRDDDKEWQLPSRVLESDNYLLIFSSGKDRRGEQLHTSFRLSQSGTTLSLLDRASTNESAKDTVIIPALVRNSSFGRDPRELSRTCHFAFPTPGTTNVKECFDDNSLGAPQLSQQSGFYDSDFELEITAGSTDILLYYTLDGTYPDPVNNPASTQTYSGPIRITELPAVTGPLSRIDTTITDPVMTFTRLFQEPPPVGDDIRPATVIRTRSEFSVETSATFFVGQEFASTIPVMSLILNPDHLFDKETGIYVAGATYENWRNSPAFSPESRWGTPANYTQRGREWERPFANNTYDAVRMQVCTPTTCDTTRNIGIRINGNASRIQPMHALRLIARNDYGDETFTQDFFGDGATGWKSLVLRNGGNNYRGWDDRFHFNDGFFQSAMAEMNLATQAFQPMNVFINGEYWGVHNLRERYDKTYYSVRFNVKESNVATIDSIFSADAPEELTTEWDSLPSRFRQLNPTASVGIDKIESLIDVDSFFDFIIANTYAGNTDWPGNNSRMWRSIDVYDEVGAGVQDGRWRWVLMDLDRIGGTPSGSPQIDNLEAFDKISPSSNSYQARLLHSLLRFPELKQQFFDRYDERLSTMLTASRMEERLNDFAILLAPEMTKHARRWPLFDAPIGTDTWSERVESVRAFVTQRPQIVRDHLTYLRSQW